MLVVEFAGRSAMVERMALNTLEWMPPQRPRSEETAMMRWFGLRSSDNTSDFSNRAVCEGGGGGCVRRKGRRCVRGEGRKCVRGEEEGEEVCEGERKEVWGGGGGGGGV